MALGLLFGIAAAAVIVYIVKGYFSKDEQTEYQTAGPGYVAGDHTPTTPPVVTPPTTPAPETTPEPTPDPEAPSA